MFEQRWATVVVCYWVLVVWKSKHALHGHIKEKDRGIWKTWPRSFKLPVFVDVILAHLIL